MDRRINPISIRCGDFDVALIISDLFGYATDAQAAKVGRLGKERLMTSGVLSILVEEQTAKLQQSLQQALQRMVEDVIVVRFPKMPVEMVYLVRQIPDPEQLQRLHTAILHAPDQAAAEQLLRAAVPRPS